MGNIGISIERINALNPLDIVKDETVRERFILIHNSLWGENTGEVAYESESMYFNNALTANTNLQKATRFSIFTAFLDIAINGVSVEPRSKALAYLQGRNVKIGTHKDANGKVVNDYEGRLALVISGYGELMMRQRAGQIRHADNPVVVYEGDEFSFGESDGRKTVNYTCHIPHATNHIIAAFMRITRPDGTIDYSIMFEEDWVRLKEYSGKNNRKWDDQSRQYVGVANELYSSNGGGIDTGFLKAKLIKHAFAGYPKLPVGKYTQLESQQEYSVSDNVYGVAEPSPYKTEPKAFGNDEPKTGVTVDTGDDDAF